MHRRRAFTIIEVLVVMAILGVLAALILSAVLGARQRGPETQVQAQFTALGDALERFKSEFHGRYPPSTILLKEDRDYSVTAAQQQSANLLRELWPNIQLNDAGLPGWDFNGDGDSDDAWTLDGPQCLVFFLGGMPDPATGVGVGFSRDPLNPFQRPGDVVTDEVSRAGPYFAFEADNLIERAAGNPFRAVADAGDNGTVLVYFSSYNGRGYVATDCAALDPYVKAGVTPATYWNPDTYQLLSAGRDGEFGDGGDFSPDDANLLDDNEQDNLANFHQGVLGQAGGG